MDVDFNRERAWWEAKAPEEEQDLGDEAVNRALRWREIERHLAGVHTVLDVGAGTGAFSIPLAQRGFAVTWKPTRRRCPSPIAPLTWC